MRNCSLSMRRYFRLLAWGWLNVSKEILLTLSKFHEKLPSGSRDIKSFLPGKRECTPSSSLSTKVFPTGRMGRKSSPLTKSLLISHTHFLFPSPTKGSFPHSCYNLVKTSLCTQVMLTLILIDVQDLENVIFSFEKSSNGETHSLLLRSPLPDKKSCPAKGDIFSHCLTLFGKPCQRTKG